MLLVLGVIAGWFAAVVIRDGRSTADHEVRLRTVESQPTPLTAGKVWTFLAAAVAMAAALFGALHITI